MIIAILQVRRLTLPIDSSLVVHRRGEEKSHSWDWRDRQEPCNTKRPLHCHTKHGLKECGARTSSGNGTQVEEIIWHVSQVVYRLMETCGHVPKSWTALTTVITSLIIYWTCYIPITVRVGDRGKIEYQNWSGWQFLNYPYMNGTTILILKWKCPMQSVWLEITAREEKKPNSSSFLIFTFDFINLRERKFIFQMCHLFQNSSGKTKADVMQSYNMSS